MPIEVAYSRARENFASLLDQVTQNHEIVIIHRRGEEDTALISASELASLTETAHLLRSPANARRLLSALQRALLNEGEPSSVNDLRVELGLNGEEA